MNEKRGFRLQGIHRSGATKREEFLKTVKVGKVFTMKTVAKRLRDRGHIVTSTQALANWAHNTIEGGYIEKVGEAPERLWRRIA